MKTQNEPAPDLDYRQHLEKLKSRDGSIKNSEYADQENIKKDLTPELRNLTEALLVGMTKNQLNNYFKILALKTGLSEEEIEGIYHDHEDLLVAEAQVEINKNTSRKKAIGLVAAKSAFYIGAGLATATSTVATLGFGGLAGGGIIAGVRMLDRLITERAGKKKLDNKLREIKANKNINGRDNLRDNMAAAISLKKKIEISRVDLNSKGDRAKLIDDYLEERDRNDLLNLEPGELPKYKDQMIRVMEGLDDIDKFNQEKEPELNKKSLSGFLAKVEGTISGKTSRERVASTAVFIGLGIAARELPVVRRIMSAYAGYRLGGMVADNIVRKKEKKQEKNIDPSSEINDKTEYRATRRKLLDRDFQKNNPQEYLQLKEQVDKAENIMLGTGSELKDAPSLNAGLDSKIKSDWQSDRKHQFIKGAGRLLGAVIGLAGGEAIRSIFKHKSEAVKAPDKVINNSVKSFGAASDSTEITPDDSAVTPPDSSKQSFPAPSVKVSALEDIISNRDFKPGQHDSIWRSTEQIFKDHAEELGYNKNSGQTLEAWAQTQTGRAINNSGALTDKVFEGNMVSLKADASGLYHVEAEQGTGSVPGHLESIHSPEVPAVKEGDDVVSGSSQASNLELPAAGAEVTHPLNPITPETVAVETSDVHKTFNSVDDLMTIPRGESTNMGHLTVTRGAGGFYKFETDKGGIFKMKINPSDIRMSRGNVFHVIVGDRVLTEGDIRETIWFKQLVYDNFPDKETPLAKELLKEITKHIETEKSFGVSKNNSDLQNLLAKNLHDNAEKGGGVSDSNNEVEVRSENGLETVLSDQKNNLDQGSNIVEQAPSSSASNHNHAEVEVKPGSVLETVISDHDKKGFNSFSDFAEFPRGAKANLGELIMERKANGIYKITEPGGRTFQLGVNRSAGARNDMFAIIKNGRPLSEKDIRETIFLKQIIYNNLPDKEVPLAKELFEEIARDTTAEEFIKDFNL